MVSTDRLRCRLLISNRAREPAEYRPPTAMPRVTVAVSSTSAIVPPALVAYQSGLGLLASSTNPDTPWLPRCRRASRRPGSRCRRPGRAGPGAPRG